MKSPKVYQSGNAWQQNRYSFMSEYNKKRGIKNFGTSQSGDQPYFHLLTSEDSQYNFLDPVIQRAVEERFDHHKAGDRLRVMTNTVASQPCCFNLLVPLKLNPDVADKLFSKLLEKEVTINHIEIEFTPNTLRNLKGFELSGDESLKDQGANRGTDADVAVFYTSANRKGVILIEFKYIESEFSQCGSFKAAAQKIGNKCTSKSYFDDVIIEKLTREKGRLHCGYLKYTNWELTSHSEVFDQSKIKAANGCPFRFSGQQLWRNLLLVENVARSRNLDEFHFWVLSPEENTELWNNQGNVEAEFRYVLSSQGNLSFRKLNLGRDFFDVLKPVINEKMQTWSAKFEKRYLKISL